MEQRIIGIQADYLSKFDGATTDLQRQRVAAEHRAAAIDECFAATPSMHIELDCELENSQASTTGYAITYKVTDTSLNLGNLPDEINLPSSYEKLGEASAGTRFRLKVPIGIIDGSNPNAYDNLRNTIWSRGGSRIDFGQDLTRIGDLPSKSTIKLERPGGNRHALMKLTVSLYAIWSYASIESDEIPDLPKYTPPNIPELGGHRGK
jgi:hypothetical protein